MNTHKPFPPTLTFFLAFLPVAIYFFCAWSESVNIPAWDDFDYLEDITEIQHTDSFAKQLALLFDEHVESRVAFIRSLFLFSFALLGEADIKLILILSNFTLIGLWIILCRSSAPTGDRVLFSIPLALILFQLQTWHNMIWLPATHHFFTIYFSGAAFYWLVRNSRGSFLLACVHSAIAPFTLGGGLGVIPLGTLYLFSVKRIKDGWLWLAGGSILFLLYFHNYESLAPNQTLGVFANPERVLTYSLAFLGSTLAFKNFWISIGVGAAFFIYLIYLVRIRYDQRNPFIFLFMLWIIFSALIASAFRSDIAFDQALAYRYKIYSATFLAMIYISARHLFFSEKKSEKRFITGAILLSVCLYGGAALDGKPKLEFQREMLVFRLNHWLTHNSHLFFHDEAAANRIMTDAIQNGTYNPPYQLLSVSDEFLARPLADPKICQEESEEKQSAGFNGFAIGPENNPLWFRMEGMLYDSPDNPLHIVLRSGSQRMVFPAQGQESPELSAHYRSDGPNTGFLAIIPFEYLAGGPYQIGLCGENQTHFYNYYISAEKSRIMMKMNSGT